MEEDEKDNDDHKDDEDNKDDKEEEDFFAEILKMTKFISLPNLVRLGQREQVSEYYIVHTYIHT